ncbi:hypothetical protein HDV02_006597, partial [Globomyces sp. JEL0801]
HIMLKATGVCFNDTESTDACSNQPIGTEYTVGIPGDNKRVLYLTNKDELQLIDGYYV